MNREERRRRRRSGQGTGELPLDLITLVTLGAVADIFSPPGMAELNRLRMSSCTMLWNTSQAAVGICPGYDDFLVWLDPDTESATAVPMTLDVIADFKAQVVPVLREHATASHALRRHHQEMEDEWALGVCVKFLDGTLDKESRDLPDDRPAIQDASEHMAGVKAAHDRAVAALAAFVNRHPHQPDLV